VAMKGYFVSFGIYFFYWFHYSTFK
jgi:hypothetical protein